MNDDQLREQFEVRLNKDDPTIREIFLRGQKVYEWNDLMNENAWEDLTWNRAIGDLFFDAVGIGLHLAMILFKETIANERRVELTEIERSLAKIDALKG